MQRRHPWFVNETADQYVLIHQAPGTGGLSVRVDGQVSNRTIAGSRTRGTVSHSMSGLGQTSLALPPPRNPARPPRRPSTRQGATHVHADHRRPRPRRKHAARHPRNRAVRLDTYLVLSDYYHRPTQLSATHTAFELLSLDEARPRIVEDPVILGLTRVSRSRLGSRLFTWFFV